MIKFYDFMEEDGSATILPCSCRISDTVVAVIMPKISGDSMFLGRYLTARGFSTLKAAEHAILHYLWNRFVRLGTRFDVGIAVFPLRMERFPSVMTSCSSSSSSLLLARIPRSPQFLPYEHLPENQKHFPDFHRSWEEEQCNSFKRVYDGVK